MTQKTLWLVAGTEDDQLTPQRMTVLFSFDFELGGALFDAAARVSSQRPGPGDLHFPRLNFELPGRLYTVGHDGGRRPLPLPLWGAVERGEALLAAVTDSPNTLPPGLKSTGWQPSRHVTADCFVRATGLNRTDYRHGYFTLGFERPAHDDPTGEDTVWGLTPPPCEAGSGDDDFLYLPDALWDPAVMAQGRAATPYKHVERVRYDGQSQSTWEVTDV